MTIVGNGELWWVIDFLPFENCHFGLAGNWTPDFSKKKYFKQQKNFSIEWDSNLQPQGYELNTLPLSYEALLAKKPKNSCSKL